MNNLLHRILVAVAWMIVAGTALAWQQETAWRYATGQAYPATRSKDETTGREIVTYAITPVAADKGGNAVLSGAGLPLEARPRGQGFLLVVKFSRQDDPNLQERFLAYPVEAGDPMGVRLVTEAGPGCEWTPYKISAAGYGVSAEWDMFLASDRPAKGQLLCADDKLALVLIDPPGSMKRFQPHPIPGKNVVGQMREIIAPRTGSKR